MIIVGGEIYILLLCFTDDPGDPTAVSDKCLCPDPQHAAFAVIGILCLQLSGIFLRRLNISLKQAHGSDPFLCSKALPDIFPAAGISDRPALPIDHIEKSLQLIPAIRNQFHPLGVLGKSAVQILFIKIRAVQKKSRISGRFREFFL